MFGPTLPMWANNPLMQEYAARNPNSLFASMAAGSNNTGASPAMATPQTSNNPRSEPMGSGSAQAIQAFGMGGYAQQAPVRTPLGGRGIPSFAAGGMMAPGGVAVRPGAPMPSQVPADEPQMGADAPMPPDASQIDQEAQRFVQAHPDVVQKVQGVVQQAIQSGELTPDELNMAVQLAKAALANPASYPQIRQFAIKNGLGTEQDLPQTVDQGLLFTLIVLGKTMGAGKGSAAMGNAMEGQPPKQAGILPEYSEGGPTGDKKHLAMVHEHEYVIPKDALMYHGKKTFDKLVETARNPDGKSGS